jgi:hypothetical protein
MHHLDWASPLNARPLAGQAMEELSPSQEEVREVFARFGRAYYFAEVLHRGLCNLYVAHQIPDSRMVTRYRLEEHFSLAFKMTLGQVWNAVTQHYSRETQSVVASAIDRRNFLAHHFWYERAHLLSTSKGRCEMLKELDDAADLFQSADALLEGQGPDVLERMGLDESHFKAALEEIQQGSPPEPLHSQRRPKKMETVVNAYEEPTLLLETDDGVIWQLSDEGLGWCRYDRADPAWAKSVRLAPYLPATFNPKPPRVGPWHYDLSLGRGATLLVRPGQKERTFRWSLRSPSRRDAG